MALPRSRAPSQPRTCAADEVQNKRTTTRVRAETACKRDPSGSCRQPSFSRGRNLVSWEALEHPMRLASRESGGRGPGQRRGSRLVMSLPARPKATFSSTTKAGPYHKNTINPPTPASPAAPGRSGCCRLAHPGLGSPHGPGPYLWRTPPTEYGPESGHGEPKPGPPRTARPPPFQCLRNCTSTTRGLLKGSTPHKLAQESTRGGWTVHSARRSGAAREELPGTPAAAGTKMV